MFAFLQGFTPSQKNGAVFTALLFLTFLWVLALVRPNPDVRTLQLEALQQELDGVTSALAPARALLERADARTKKEQAEYAAAKLESDLQAQTVEALQSRATTLQAQIQRLTTPVQAAIIPQAKAQTPDAEPAPLTFGQDLSKFPLPEGFRLPSPAPESKAPTDKLAVLEKACGGEAKCTCVNAAIFKHDSSWSTAGVGKRTNNPCNTRPSKNHPNSHSTEYTVNGPFARFASFEDGVQSCVALYRRGYEAKTAFSLVKVWTGHANDPKWPSTPAEREYLSAVQACYS